MDRNAYEALSELAGRENWCWNIACTTCGCMHFRFALKLLATGRHPDEADWPVHGGQIIPEDLGPFPPRLLPRDQAALGSIVEGANLEWIADNVRFPDWLGHLGLVLQATAQEEVRTGKLTAALAPRLSRLCAGDVQRELQEMHPRDRRLTWHFLEAVEGAIRRGSQ